MSRLLTVWSLLLLSCPALAAGGGVILKEAQVNLDDLASLQRGARYFVNYCLGCHSASFMRYNRMAKDLEIPEETLRENLLFTADKVGEKMENAMRPDEATGWFGNAPPDLSVIARARGADWLYSYLLAFYADASRPLGVNNLVFPDVAMPHVFAGLQGVPVLKESESAQEGAVHHARPQPISELLELKEAGALNPAEFREAIRDLVNFLVYLAEPAKLDRYQIGFWVLVFLAVFIYLTRALYKEYWKDIH